jgi:hypothetical protein
VKREFCREFKGKFCQPDREFESYLLRQLVCCFYGENSLAEIVAKCPQVGSGRLAASGRRERILEIAAPL